MKLQKFFVSASVVCALALMAVNAQAARYSTNDAGGADAELRESSPTTARGTGSEIASRIASGSRNSVIYLKFGVGDISASELASKIKVRTTYRNTNLSVSRIEDLATAGPNTGYDYFVLDPTLANADWDEATISPQTAFIDGLGYNLDFDLDTKATGSVGSPTAGLTYLGTKLYDSNALHAGANRLRVGGNFDLDAAPGSALHNAIVAAQGTAHQTVTVVMNVVHEVSNPNGNWLNFNYLFNPKEQTTLNGDPISPHSGADNSTGDYSPALLTVPEPTSLALLGMASLALVARRKRS